MLLIHENLVEFITKDEKQEETQKDQKALATVEKGVMHLSTDKMLTDVGTNETTPTH